MRALGEEDFEDIETSGMAPFIQPTTTHSNQF
jgi:hypothetical protein